LIAFETDLGDYPAKQGIYVMNAADGSAVRRITTLPASATFDGAARFSPDGRHILFTRTVDDRTAALFIVGLDGSGLHPITDDSVKPGDATWSPDGRTIAFEADSQSRTFGGAWVVGADGHGLTDLVARSGPGPAEGFADPVWSPDGAWILMLHGLHGPDGAFTHGGLAVIRPDGSDLAFVADGLGAEHQPDWSATHC
jgi:TolB protein